MYTYKYQTDVKPDVTPEQLELIKKTDAQLESYIKHKNLNQYLTPILKIHEDAQLELSLYCIDPENIETDTEFNIGVIGILITDIENQHLHEHLTKTIKTIEQEINSPTLHQQITKHNPQLTPAQQKHIKTIHTILSKAVISTTRRLPNDGLYTIDNDYFKNKIIKLAETNLSLHHIMDALLYIIPENKNEYQKFITDIQTLPADWLDKLYEIDPQLDVSSEKIFMLYAIQGART